ncbi:MAG: response regulator [Verrucomicrobiales bacterium]|nr:response regulator [Verrucomicrobiales bacterium]
MAVKVLAIDDEVGFTRLVKMNLERDGEFEVCVENDSNNALSTALEFLPDVILLDIVMPGMDGGDVATLFKNTPELKDIPIIMMTALMSPHESGEAGYKDSPSGIVLPKPVNLETLKKCLEDAVRGSA